LKPKLDADAFAKEHAPVFRLTENSEEGQFVLRVASLKADGKTGVGWDDIARKLREATGSEISSSAVRRFVKRTDPPLWERMRGRNR
jgi:hypothetical protein